MSDEDLDLDYGDELVESDKLVVADMSIRSVPKWQDDPANFDRAIEHIVRHRVAKGLSADGSKGERKPAVPDDEFRVTVPGHDVDWTELPQASKRLAKRALDRNQALEDHGRPERWTVKARHSKTHVPATLFQEDSEDHSRGDIRFPAKDVEHYSLLCTLNIGSKPLAGFERYDENGHKGTHWHDRLVGTQFSLVAADFNQWFDAYAPLAKPRAVRKTKEQKQDERNLALIHGEEWT